MNSEDENHSTKKESKETYLIPIKISTDMKDFLEKIFPCKDSHSIILSWFLEARLNLSELLSSVTNLLKTDRLKLEKVKTILLKTAKNIDTQEEKRWGFVPSTTHLEMTQRILGISPNEVPKNKIPETECQEVELEIKGTVTVQIDSSFSCEYYECDPPKDCTKCLIERWTEENELGDITSHNFKVIKIKDTI